ncbi:MAG: efflux RND transporter periplasmic adaptor subunit [Desulfotomaculaceae bacterium]|nr:efflux RND transporter periplasmic adaptor subunit [Desulfotomaculaceae bacterium]
MRRGICLAIIFLFSVLMGGCGEKNNSQEEVLVPVEVSRAQVVDMSHILDTSGEIIAGAEATVAPRVSARIVAVHVRMGDRVRQGQVLFELDSTEARNTLSIAQAGVSVARAGLNKAKQAVADAQLNYDRSKALYEGNAISQAQLDQADSALKNAVLGVELAEGQLVQAEANVQNAQENLSNFVVTAPLSGQVAAVNVENGEMAGPQTNAVTIVNLDPVKVRVNLSENVVGAIKPGVEIPVDIKALNKTVTGTVAAIAPQSDPATRAFPVEILLGNQQGEIKAGMVASLRLETGVSQGAVAVPADAVLERDGQYSVFLLVDGVAKETPVKIGIASGQLTEIKEGVQEGQEVIVSGNRLVTDSQKVEVVNDRGGAVN